MSIAAMHRLLHTLQLSPHLAHLVRSITFDFSPYLSPMGLPSESMPEHELAITTLLPLLQPTLTAITLISLRQPPSRSASAHHEDLRNVLRAAISSPRIERLSFFDCDFGNRTTFVDLMGTTPRSLTSLDIRDIHILDIGRAPAQNLPPTAGPPILIQSLSISARYDAPTFLAGWFNTSPSRSVQVKKLKPATSGNIMPFANVLAPYIEELDLLSSSARSIPYLGPFRSLTKLSIWCHENTATFLKTISSANTARLELLALTVTNGSGGVLIDLGCELDEYLASEDLFPRLRVTLDLADAGAVDGASRPIRQLMPCLVAKRRLQVRLELGVVLSSDKLEGLDVGFNVQQRRRVRIG